MQIGFVTAFLGGSLALLSPCGALLLPAFFASTVGTRWRLLTHGGVFFLGLAITLVPLGLGLGALGLLLSTERGLVIAVTSVVLVFLGIAQILGFGFDPSRMLPGADTLRRNTMMRVGLLRTLLLGAVSGIAGFCAGPILGAILTLAIAHGDAWTSGTMLAAYAAGMVVPLIVIAALWQRMGSRGRRLLRGRTFTVLNREFHTTTVVTGALVAAMGVVFWLTNGLVGLPTLIPTDLQTWIQERSGLLADPVVDVLGIIALAALALAAWGIARRRWIRRHYESEDPRPKPFGDEPEPAVPQRVPDSP